MASVLIHCLKRLHLLCHFDQREKSPHCVPMYFVYCLTNKYSNVMYIGMTNNLVRRVYEHKTKQVSGFTEKYNVNRLVYFEETPDVEVAIAREKEIKKWRRAKKNVLVTAMNPEWKDLSEGWYGDLSLRSR